MCLLDPERIEDREDVGHLSGDVGGLGGQPAAAVPAPAVVDHLVVASPGELVGEGHQEVAHHPAVDEEDRCALADHPHVELVAIGDPNLVVGSGITRRAAVSVMLLISSLLLSVCARAARPSSGR